MKGRRRRGVKGDKKKSDEGRERKRHGRWQSENETLKKDCIKEICSVREKRGQERSQRGVETKGETDRNRGTA